MLLPMGSQAGFWLGRFSGAEGPTGGFLDDDGSNNDEAWRTGMIFQKMLHPLFYAAHHACVFAHLTCHLIVSYFGANLNEKCEIRDF